MCTDGTYVRASFNMHAHVERWQLPQVQIRAPAGAYYPHAEIIINTHAQVARGQSNECSIIPSSTCSRQCPGLTRRHKSLCNPVETGRCLCLRDTEETWGRFCVDTSEVVVQVSHKYSTCTQYTLHMQHYCYFFNLNTDCWANIIPLALWWTGLENIGMQS